MKPPRLYLGLLLLFWGVQTDSLWLGIAAAAGLEWARMLKNGFDLKPSDFNTFVDISTVLLAGTLVTAFVVEAEKAIFILLQWLPLIFFPVILAQECSTAGEIDIRAFFLTARKKIKQQSVKQRSLDVGYFYAVLVLISAGSTPSSKMQYSIAVAFFLSWALFYIRSRRYRIAAWICCLLIVIACGYAGQRTIELTSARITQMMIEYYDRYYGGNPFKSATALGEMGRLKLSDTITARVIPGNYSPGRSYLLQNATYSIFNSPHWFAQSQFTPVQPGKDQTFWLLNPTTGHTQTMTVYTRPTAKKAVLLLPPGTVTISDMKAGACEKNRMQAVRIKEAPGLIKTRVAYTGDLPFDPVPTDRDLSVSEQDLPVIREIAERLRLIDLPPNERISRIRTYFAETFTYTLDLHGKGNFKTPLQNFLQNTRSGHCELFATATVLLLRHAGIPARYTTGYIAHEYSPLSNQLIVRQRDAHAWVKVYINRQWQALDTTPASFLEIDAAQVSPSAVSDLFSFIGFQISLLRHETGAKLFREYGLWLLLPMLVYLAFRLRKSKHVRWVKTEDLTGEKRGEENDDTDFITLESYLVKQGLTRNAGESYLQWLNRVAGIYDSIELTTCLEVLARDHAKDRYSRTGLTVQEKTALRETIQQVLDLIKSSQGNSKSPAGKSD